VVCDLLPILPVAKEEDGEEEGKDPEVGVDLS
jgi:hypothetical protein